MRLFRPFVWLVPVLLIGVSTPSPAGEDVGPFVQAVWLVQRHGKSDVVRPEYDQKLKGELSKALGKQAVLTAAGVQGLMEPTTFAKLAGDRRALIPTRFAPARVRRAGVGLGIANGQKPTVDGGCLSRFCVATPAPWSWKGKDCAFQPMLMR